MRILSLLFLLVPVIIPAQKYHGIYNDPEAGVGYTVEFLLRADSTVSIVFEERDSAGWKDGMKICDNHPDDSRYYDFHGVIRRRPDGYYAIQSKLVFSMRLVAYNPEYHYFMRDTLLLSFDSVLTWFPDRMTVSYGNISNAPFYCSSTPVLGFPRSHFEKDTSYSVRGARDYCLAYDATQFREGDTMTIDIGYRNPVTQRPVTFEVPFGTYPLFDGDFGWEFEVEITDGRLLMPDHEMFDGMDLFIHYRDQQRFILNETR